MALFSALVNSLRAESFSSLILGHSLGSSVPSLSLTSHKEQGARSTRTRWACQASPISTPKASHSASGGNGRMIFYSLQVPLTVSILLLQTHTNSQFIF